MVERTVKIDTTPVPECFRDEAPADDPMKLILARAQRAREAAVAVAETILLQNKVKECYRKEGVNHYRNCVEVTRAYFKKIQQPKFMDGPVEMEDVN